MSIRTLSGYFCDDIREEIGGKTSLIGCYGPEMIVPEFPVTLSKLCVAVKIISQGAQDYNSVRVTVLRGQDEIASAEMPAGALSQLKEIASGTPRGEDVHRVVAVNFVMSPVQIESATSLKVRAIVNGESVQGLSLKVDTVKTIQTVKSGASERVSVPRQRKKGD